MRITHMLVFPVVAALLAACGGIEGEEVLAPREPQGGFFFGTGADGGDAAGGSGIVIGETVTFNDTIGPLFMTYCSACHNSSSPAGGLDLTSFDALMLTDVITPGDADGSELIYRIENGIMPPAGQRTPSAEEIAAIRTWVEDGATNN